MIDMDTEEVTIEFTAKQEEFLSSSADVTLIGGGAGSGKSLVAVFAVLVLNDPAGPRYLNPHHRALIYRHHCADLTDLIDKTREWYPLIDPGATYNKSDRTWTFSSGAQVIMHYFERYSDAEIYLQGKEYSVILADELGQYEDDKVFKYAQSRLRNKEGFKNYYLATSNPSRYKWLRQYFGINDVGDSSEHDVEFILPSDTVLTKHIRYIQARLSDNKHIPESYAANIMDMSEEDRRALLDGRWDAYESVDGQVYRYEIEAMQKEHRICSVPVDASLPVYTSWDIGVNDLCCILFFQFVGKERHYIDMILDNNKSIRDYYVPLIKKYEDTKGYRYGTHWLPHDAAQRDKFSATALLDQVSEVLPKTKKLPIAPIEAGIQLTKQMMKDVWIDSSIGLDEQLVNYKRRYQPVNQQWGEPIHDIYSHASDAFRGSAYVKPEVNIDLEKFNRSMTGSTNPFVQSNNSGYYDNRGVYTNTYTSSNNNSVRMW